MGKAQNLIFWALFNIGHLLLLIPIQYNTSINRQWVIVLLKARSPRFQQIKMPILFPKGSKKKGMGAVSIAFFI